MFLAAATADPLIPAADPGVTNNDVLLTQTGSKFDSQGNDYETDNYLVTNGSAPGTPTSKTQFDLRRRRQRAYRDRLAPGNETGYAYDGWTSKSETDTEPRPTHDPGTRSDDDQFATTPTTPTASFDPLDNVTAFGLRRLGQRRRRIPRAGHHHNRTATVGPWTSATSRPTAG